ncbi:hypothetical protein ACM01_14645 [Streptomyces viridochromogenes]|uniref:Uncharacterized protein n=1 Tax=Streptomyces viridochromogenes TaxID=1938 RepID=A0A0J7ZFW0_STRVR|nr:hypothetical protein [Streptomyces viridochromogenes]KMS74297.1 hypothetical protein ACM01_14645 [Streptomyces viridochromogenes]
MAHTFDGLVEMQKAADEAHGRVLELQDTYGRPTVTPWLPEQTEAYEKAWKHWRKLAGDVQAAVTTHAKGEDKPRFEVEVTVRTTARHPEAATA